MTSNEEFLAKARSIGFYKGRQAQKKLDRDLEAYASSRKEGNQPDSTSRFSVERAKMFSDHYGTPYRGDNLTETAQKAGIMDEVREYTPEQKKTIREGLQDGQRRRL